MLLNEKTCEALLSELSLFSTIPTQTSVQETAYTSYHPVNAISGNAPLEFHITPGDDEYLDLYSSYLFMTCSIRGLDGNDLGKNGAGTAPRNDGGYVFPINYFASTQFKSVDVFL